MLNIIFFEKIRYHQESCISVGIRKTSIPDVLEIPIPYYTLSSQEGQVVIVREDAAGT